MHSGPRTLDFFTTNLLFSILRSIIWVNAMIPSPMSAVQLMGSLTDYKSSQSREGIAGVSKNIHGSDIGSSEAERKVLEDKALTAAEISKHKSDEDAWIVVDGLVYDITCFLQTHPGGAEVVSPSKSTVFLWCPQTCTLDS